MGSASDDGSSPGRRRSEPRPTLVAMEDRCTPVLHLELGDETPEACGQRAGARRTFPAPDASRGGRTPRPGVPACRGAGVRDGRTLVVVEAADGFVAPAAPADVTAATPSNATRGRARASSPASRPGPPDRVDRPPGPRARRRPARTGVTRPHPPHRRRRIPGSRRSRSTRTRQRATRASCTSPRSTPCRGRRDVLHHDRPSRPAWAGRHQSYAQWADWRAGHGRLFYCNTFRRLGERAVAGNRRPPVSGRRGRAEAQRGEQPPPAHGRHDDLGAVTVEHGLLDRLERRRAERREHGDDGQRVRAPRQRGHSDHQVVGDPDHRQPGPAPERVVGPPAPRRCGGG